MDLERLLAGARARPASRVHFVGATGAELEQLSHAGLASCVDELACELGGLGLDRGDIVGLLGANSIEWLISDLALLALGCVPCPIPEDILGADDGTLLRRYRLTACVSVHRPEEGRGAPHAMRSVRGVTVRLLSPPPSGQPLKAETATLSFSSGTSGRRKCLQLSRRGIENTMRVSSAAWRVGEGDHLLLFLPLAYIQQRTLSYTALYHGSDLTICRAAGALRAVKEHPVSLLVAPPAFYETIQRMCGPAGDVGRFLGLTMRLMLVGSAPVSTTLLESYRSADAPLFEVYGMNEFGWISFNLPGNDRIGSAGALVEGVSIVPQPSDEIVVRGVAPQSPGYYVDGMEEEANVHVAPDTVATGDLGTVDADGRLFLRGRSGNVVALPAGMKIAPEVLERRIEESDPRIVKALVFLPDGAAILSCTLWVPDDLDGDDRNDIGGRLRQLSQSFPAHERLGPVSLRSALELTSESGLLTQGGKPSRARMLRAVSASCVG